MNAIKRLLTAPFSARTRREYLYLWVTLLPSVPVFALALLGILTTVLSLVGIGLPILLMVLWLARCVPKMFRLLARAVLGWEWNDHDRRRETGIVRRVVSLYADGTAWKSVLYGILKLPLTLVGVYLSTVAIVVGTLAVTFPVWWFVSRDAFGRFDSNQPWPHTWVLAVQGVVVLLAFPWLLRLAVAVDRALVFALLAPNLDRERVALLQSGRIALTTANEASLRRIERDLHDGTQARLVAIGMTLARLEHQVGDPGIAAMVTSAKTAVTDTLDELREIIRGLHPPALDSGLDVALTTLAARSTLPVEVTYALDSPPTESIATAVYFAASELLANATQHSNATRATVNASRVCEVIVLSVTDNGHGGAQVSAVGSGLAGIRDRVQALDGQLNIESPRGGPTTITVTLPNR
jgi:signal transduction histidine kinase